ncbi:hypothetical protein DFR41_1032 [Pseudacidovorax intermedius]|uniref:DUF3789 domain-containing protein n=1 Tax=Pseudacidovorax intermedius TaxID=433924 RepID=A0A370FGY4_9BURK|nr:DUF3789 domain-containing protein [Pseudacidovorax intermedius]RDI25848.1 hypothetical protein DFR41_1032 [Pseudacidovorax intermedius]
MSAFVLVVWIGGVLVGGTFGVLVMALCVAAGRADDSLAHQDDEAVALRGQDL